MSKRRSDIVQFICYDTGGTTRYQVSMYSADMIQSKAVCSLKSDKRRGDLRQLPSQCMQQKVFQVALTTKSKKKVYRRGRLTPPLSVVSSAAKGSLLTPWPGWAPPAGGCCRPIPCAGRLCCWAAETPLSIAGRTMRMLSKRTTEDVLHHIRAAFLPDDTTARVHTTRMA